MGSQTTSGLLQAGLVPQIQQMFQIIQKFSALHNVAQLKNPCFSMEMFVSSYKPELPTTPARNPHQRQRELHLQSRAPQGSRRVIY